MDFGFIDIHETSAHQFLFDEPIWERAGGFLRGSFFADPRLLRDWARGRAVVAFTARDEDASIVGFALVVPPEPMGDPAHIALLYVDPGQRRQGVGGRLLDHLSDRYGEVTVHLGSRHDDVWDFFARRDFGRVRREQGKNEAGVTSTVARLRRLRAASQSVRSMAMPRRDFRYYTPVLAMGNFVFLLLVVCMSLWSGTGLASGALRGVAVLPGLVYFALACRTRQPPPGLPVITVRTIVLLVNAINLVIALQQLRFVRGVSSFSSPGVLLSAFGVALFAASMIWLAKSFREIR